MTENKWYMNNGCVGKNFYKSYIKDRVSKQTQAKFNKLLQDDDEDFIDYYRVNIENPDDRENQYSSLWFFDIDLEKGYMPVFISNINTSSCLAMEMCEMDGEDEDEDEDNWKNMDDLLEYAPNGSEKSKDTLKNVLNGLEFITQV